MPDSPRSGAANGSEAENKERKIQDFLAELKRVVHKTVLRPELREQILADSPPPEEERRMYLELIEKGGLSSREFLDSLGLEVGPNSD